ncbi:MAG TPA: PAS domain-containing protein, partial [Solirubrobacter sp.]|nr:PAS domain-containing protein [Solirubrobacter sp.]
MNPVTNTPDAVMAEAAEPVDALDALLRQIVGGYFVLTDGQGSVSKWSEPAELLFSRPSEEILGHGFFETLIAGTLPPEGQAWRAFLDAGEPPHVPGTVRLTGRRADGDDFPLEAVFVPVKLDEGFDFSLFLEDLSFELPLNLMLLRMRQQHPVVVRALRQALEPEAQPWEGWRTAGTLVVFKPLSATPWVESELARREAERAAADAETEERLTNLDPGIQGGVNDLDDAAAVVARLLSALERIDELERVAGGLPAQLDEARREAEQRAAAAERDFGALRSDLQRAVSAVPSELDRHEQERRVAKVEEAALEAASKLGARLEQAERERAQADARLAETVAAAEARASEAIAESARRIEARVGSLDVSAQLEQVRAEHEEAAQAARTELASMLERLERDRERERSEARAELAAALERIEQLQRGADAVREQLSTVTVERAAAHGLAGDDRRRLEDLARETEALRSRVEALGEGSDLREALHAQSLATAAQFAELRDALTRSEAATAE